MHGHGHCNEARRDRNQPSKATQTPYKLLVTLRGWF